jgi:hypothetical protein
MHARRPFAWLWLAVVAGCALLAWAPRVRGQASSNGAILGTVTDPTGAVVPGAEVTVTNVTTQSTRLLRTDAAGLFDAEALLAEGTLYNVSVKKEGFKTSISQGVKLDPGERVRLPITLQLGSATTSVTVEASVVHVDTTSGASDGTISGNQINEFQLNGRDFRSLALLIPGVNNTSSGGNPVGGGGALSGGGLTGETPISVNGLGREMNMYTVDGAYNMNTGNEINLNVTSPVDTIAEFRLLKDNYSAKYGIAGGAMVMIASKSGTREFHGNLYEFLRNDVLDARNFFAPDVSKLRQNIFGGSIGGPVVLPWYNKDRSKTFFFANVELRRKDIGAVATGAMIPQDMRNGDFTNSPTLPSGGLTLDSGSASILANLYPGVNCVPDKTHLNSACFDPNSVAMMNRFWPLPNLVVPGRFNNYINSGAETFNVEDHNYRIDQNFGSRFSLLARVSYENARDLPPNLAWGPNPAPTQKQEIKTTGFNDLLQFTANISPTTINQVSWTQTDDKPRLSVFNTFLDSVSPPLTVMMPFGFADPGKRAPNISLNGGWAGIGDAGLPENASDGEQIISEDFTKVKGAHTIQAGTMFIWGIKRQDNFATPEGAYAFGGVHTGDPAADFLLGLDSSFFQNNTRLRGYFRYHQSESYLQDDWKASKRLTLNLGVRAVYFSSDKMEGNGFDDFDPKLYDPAQAPVVLNDGHLLTNASGQPITKTGTVANLLNGVAFPGKNGVPLGIFTTPSISLGPRVGFAWDVFGTGRTSVRGGYGIGYGRTPFAIYNNDLGNYPFEQGITLINGTMTNPSLGTPGALTTVGLGTIGPPGAEFKPTMIQSWSFTVQHELAPNAIVSAAYVGSGARRVPGGYDHNYPLPVSAPSLSDPKCLQPGQAVPSGGFQFDPCLNAGLVSADITRPYLGWGGINGAANSAAEFSGTSNYHSLQTGFQYKAGRGLTFTTAYTYGHALANVRSGGWDARNTGNGAQNPRDFKAEYGTPGFDRTHVFTSGYIWDLPLLRSRHDLAGKAFGNWTFSGLTTIESGFVFDPGLSTSNGGLASRPNCVGSIPGRKSVEQWFNVDAFAAPAFGFFGNCGVGTIRGPGENTWNWALYKNFPVTERAKLQFRAEFFNLWNHPSFVGLNKDYTGTSGGFGQVNRALDPREIEFALRLDF